jgi:hypothetical protein
MTHKNRKKSRIFMFLSTGCSLLRAEGFSSSLGVLYGGIGISKLQFLIKKIEIKFPTINFYKFFSILGHQTLDPDPGSGIRISNYKNAGSGSVSGSSIKSMRIRNPASVCFQCYKCYFFLKVGFGILLDLMCLVSFRPGP